VIQGQLAILKSNNDYAVTSLGEVYSLKGIEPRLRALSTNAAAGYLSVNLTKAGKQKTCKVHKLVAEAFLGPPPFDGAHIRHIDSDPKNNAVDNLAWGSQLDNMQDRTNAGRGLKGRKVRRLTEGQKQEIREDKELGLTYAQIMDKHEVSLGTVHRLTRCISNDDL
jgi:hypothetical protein